MEDSLYDTSWLIHSIPALASSFSSLMTSPVRSQQQEKKHQERLTTHAESFREFLSRDRPRYEHEEEKEKLGGLNKCTWARLQRNVTENQPLENQIGRKRKRDARDDMHPLSEGLLVSLVYEKTTYKFIIYTTTTRPGTSKRNRPANSPLPPRTSAGQVAILLSKSSPFTLKAFINYLSDIFALTDIHPLQLSSAFIQSTLHTYLRAIHTSSSTVPNASERTVHDDFKDIIGTIRITITFSTPVAPSLKSLDVAVAPHVVQKSYMHILQETPGSNQRFFMGILSGWIMSKTGLRLPILHQNDTVVYDREDGDLHPPTSNPPMKVSRISTAAYAISVDGRLKFVLRAADAVVGPDSEEETNFVRRANEDLLIAILEEARRKVRERG
ncbi:uncharacterized protein Z518_07699 [Rhinocladiella mackenziei CBS 650.93]|uniref:Rhinocladiella mackenziei CBS 650.93 unplaced genomic scaffold supercont1.5, whole genome shotgun sequence n=1 Tax=Rhinocladiella mackenziei CBS 650.93 TaxID=1442369 RepID=A0A0D2J564_9EURO|nr:uncharacterized protein Z518_07699 [Rhinocladiella mackenziei CBS 650.93]KIX04145.1 hypothetical protein Z518_07699 [Rhinocladiella mackenziei CBS 650.93]